MSEQVTLALRAFEADHVWIREHHESLLRQYPDQWIAVREGHVIASDPDLLALRERLPDPANTCIEFITHEPLEMVL